MTASFEWRLIDILHDAESQRPNNIEFALIVLNQPLRAGRLFESLWRNGMMVMGDIVSQITGLTTL